MGGCVNLVGKTEKETALNELNWMAGWAQSLLRHLRMVHASMSVCASMGGPDHDYGETGPDPAIMDALVTQLRGVITQLDQAFELHYYTVHEGVATWKELEKKFNELKHQGMGILPVPVQETSHDAKTTKEVTKVDAGAFKHLILDLMSMQQKLQAILDKNYDRKDPNFPHLQIQVKLVDAHGNDVKTPDFDIEKIIKDEMMKRINRPPCSAPGENEPDVKKEEE